MATLTHTVAGIVFPVITRGGNTADDLLDVTTAARRALQNALDAMARAGDVANGRNHPDPDEAMVARRQHVARCETIRALMAEMEALAEHAADAL